MEKKPEYYSETVNKAVQRYHSAHMEEVKCRAQKSEQINTRIKIAAKKTGVSKSAYMLNAIRQRLDADGVTIDTVPPE